MELKENSNNNQNGGSRLESNMINNITSISDYLFFEVLPQALQIGMTADEFWRGTMNDYYAYLFAFNQKRKNQFEYDNLIAYINNSYNLLALQQVLQFSKNPKQIYPEEPFDLLSSNKKDETAEEVNIRWTNYLRSKQIK